MSTTKWGINFTHADNRRQGRHIITRQVRLTRVFSLFFNVVLCTQLQRYEGASTLFGPFTLPIYEKQYAKLAYALVNGTRLERGPAPVDLRPDVVSLLPAVLYDTPMSRHAFGDCIHQPPYSATWGQTVNAKFVSGKFNRFSFSSLRQVFVFRRFVRQDPFVAVLVVRVQKNKITTRLPPCGKWYIIRRLKINKNCIRFYPFENYTSIIGRAFNILVILLLLALYAYIFVLHFLKNLKNTGIHKHRNPFFFYFLPKPLNQFFEKLEP